MTICVAGGVKGRFFPGSHNTLTYEFERLGSRHQVEWGSSPVHSSSLIRSLCRLLTAWPTFVPVG